MRLYRHSLTWTVIFGVIALMFLRLPPMAARQDSVVNTYSALVEVDALARQQFVDAIADDRLVEGAIRGMLLQLDPYSGYISPKELPGFERRSRGRFHGVGIEVGVQDGQIVVIAPIEGSAAAREGVLAGDALLSIDGHDMKHRSVFDIEEMFIGEPGSRVRVALKRGDAAPREVLLTRGAITLRTVRGFARGLDGGWAYRIDVERGVGYVRVSSFREDTCADFDAAVRHLRAGGLRGLILDLRFNPGGFLHQAIALADRFLADGPIVATVTRRNAVDQYRAEPDPADLDVPVVVLMNAASASASEIVAGALQARGRATVVGERSFGKGSVQHLIHLVGQAAAIKLTVAYYRLPDGRIIHRTPENAETDLWGIQPDVQVPLSATETRQIQESRRALDLDSYDSHAPPLGASPPRGGGTDGIHFDRQLAAALKMIRAEIDADAGEPR